MKVAVVSLALLSFVACGKKGSDKDKDPAPTTPVVDVTPGEGNVNPANPTENPTTPGTVTPVTGPVVGLYLSACEAEGALAFASGIEVTSTHIFPATAIFSSTSCTKEALVAWGHTGDYADFASYSAFTAERSKLAGDETVASFDDKAINFLSKAGVASSFTKTKATLAPEKRLKIFVNKYAVNMATATVSGEVTLTKGPLVDGAYDIGFYCEDANKKIIRQESSYSIDAMGVISFVGKMNTWVPNQIPLVTRCQVTLAALQKQSGPVRYHDVAWSQFIEVK